MVVLCGFDFGRSPRKCIEWGQAALITPTEPGNPKIAFAKHSNSFFWTFAAFWQAQCDSVRSPLKRMVEPSHAFPAFLLMLLVALEGCAERQGGEGEWLGPRDDVPDKFLEVCAQHGILTQFSRVFG